MADPIMVLLGLQPRLVDGKLTQESIGIGSRIKEGSQPIVVFGDTGGARFPEIGDQPVPPVRWYLKRDGESAHSPTLRSLPAQYFSRKMSLRIFPVPVLGSGSSLNSTIRGILNLPSRPSRNVKSLSASSVEPCFRTTMA